MISELETRRRRAIKLIFSSGKSQVDTAIELDVHIRTVQKWVQAYRRDGQEGLTSKPKPGRPRRISEKELGRLEKILLEGAEQSGFTGELWTCPRIAKVIKTHFDIDYHCDHIPRLLRLLNWSVQRPTRKAVERDEEAIQKWAKQRWPKIKKKRS